MDLMQHSRSMFLMILSAACKLDVSIIAARALCDIFGPFVLLERLGPESSGQAAATLEKVC